MGGGRSLQVEDGPGRRVRPRGGTRPVRRALPRRPESVLGHQKRNCWRATGSVPARMDACHREREAHGENVKWAAVSRAAWEGAEEQDTGSPRLCHCSYHGHWGSKLITGMGRSAQACPGVEWAVAESSEGTLRTQGPGPCRMWGRRDVGRVPNPAPALSFSLWRDLRTHC